nr:glycosyltransferase N-terminal domain-containing protein [Gramella sp. AN32]
MVLKSAGFFSKKLHEFTSGREKLFENLTAEVKKDQCYIWIHAASLGEFEMAVPVMKMLKKNYPEHSILVSFFSPSGFKNKKQHELVDIFTYLPLDTKKNAQAFLDIIKPEMAFFIKYDLWPNFLLELKRTNCRTFLVSGVFRKDQFYFKNLGTWFKKSLKSFEHFFVQDESSATILLENGFKNISVVGDTRFDRVAAQLEIDNKLGFIEDFKENEILTVFGSTWPEDEALFVETINRSKEGKFIIAPHQIKPEKIKSLTDSIKIPVLTFSQMENMELSDFRVLILDTIGLLNKAYSYADIAYVGGAAGKTGLHNILEPATFEIPIIIGENFNKFPEAQKLQRLAGLYPVKNKEEFAEIFNKLFSDKNFRNQTGSICGHFINSNTGATRIIENYLQKN